MIEHLISTTHRLVCKILLSLRLQGTVAPTCIVEGIAFLHYQTNNAGGGCVACENGQKGFGVHPRSYYLKCLFGQRSS